MEILNIQDDNLLCSKNTIIKCNFISEIVFIKDMTSNQEQKEYQHICNDFLLIQSFIVFNKFCGCIHQGHDFKSRTKRISTYMQ
jgi:hypothetical protein